MRVLQADVAAEPRAGSGVKLRIKSQTGEEFGIELSAAKAIEFRNAVESATKSTVQSAPQPEPTTTKPHSKSRS